MKHQKMKVRAMSSVSFTVPGPPKGKARARTVHTGGRTFSYTPERTVLYENLVKTCFCQTRAQPFNADEKLRANIIAYYPIAKSSSKKKRQQMLAGLIRPTKKPDLDNVIKSILDALNKVAYHDDTQIVSLSVEKFYSDSPRVEVSISNLEND